MPDTTVMRDSQVGDTWLQQVCQANPVQRVLNPDGTPTDQILTGPVRLVFCDSLFEAKPQMRSDPNSALKHSTGILFTPYTDMALFWEEYYKCCAANFAKEYNAAMQQYAVDNPITDQGHKAVKYGGYTPGLMTTTISSNFKPPIVDARGNPIVDPKKVYAGVWAIAAVNTYASGVGKPKKGPRFGLQTLMIIGDDKPLSGGAADPRAAFAQVRVQAPVAVNPGAFAPPPGVPGGPPPQTAYMPPQGYAAAPHLPRPAPPPLGADDDYSQFTQ